MQSPQSRPTFAGMLLQHVLVFLICVAFPGGVTLMAPATWLTFERGEKGVDCTTRTCMFFVVPFKIQRLEKVIEIGQRERAGGIERKRKFGRTTNETVHVDGEGFLQIHGARDQLIEVSVSPASLDSVAAKTMDFLSSTQERSITLFVIANWKFGGLMGGILTSFTVLFLVGYTLGFLKWIINGMRRLFTRPGSP